MEVLREYVKDPNNNSRGRATAANQTSRTVTEPEHSDWTNKLERDLLSDGRHLETIFITVIAMVSTAINFLVFIFLIKTGKRLSKADKVVCNLMVCNCLVIVLFMPTTATCTYFGRWIWSESLCYFTGYLLIWLLTVISLTSLMAALDKFYAVVRPLQYSSFVTHKKINNGLCVIWGFSGVCTVLPVIWNTKVEFQREFQVCFVQTENAPIVMKFYECLFTLMFFLIPVATMIYVYTKVCLVIKLSRKRYQKNIRKKRSSDSSEDSYVTLRQSSFTQKLSSQLKKPMLVSKTHQHSKNHKAVTTTCLCLFMYVFTVLPLFCIVLVKTFFPRQELSVLPRVSVYCVFISCILSPVVHFVCNKTKEINRLKKLWAMRDYIVLNPEGMLTSSTQV